MSFRPNPNVHSSLYAPNRKIFITVMQNVLAQIDSLKMIEIRKVFFDIESVIILKGQNTVTISCGLGVKL